MHASFDFRQPLSAHQSGASCGRQVASSGHCGRAGNRALDAHDPVWSSTCSHFHWTRGCSNCISYPTPVQARSSYPTALASQRGWVLLYLQYHLWKSGRAKSIVHKPAPGILCTPGIVRTRNLGVWDHLRNLKIHKPMGPNRMDPRDLKELTDVVAKPLSRIFENRNHTNF